MTRAIDYVSADDQRPDGTTMGDILNCLERAATAAGFIVTPELIGPTWSVVRIHRESAADPVPSDQFPVIGPLTPDEARAAYESATAVPLSQERIDEIVRAATGGPLTKAWEDQS